MAETLVETIVADIQAWDDSYLAHNAKIAEKDAFGEFQLHHDKTALAILTKEVGQATVYFEDVRKRFTYMLENGYYKKDLLRNGITENDLAEFYETYYDAIGGEEYRTFYSKFAFHTSYAYKVKADELIGEYAGTLPAKRFDDKYVFMETRADRFIAIILDVVGHKTKELIKALIYMSAKRLYAPATPTLSNGGLADAGQLTSCIIMKFDDTIKSIGEMDTYTLELSKIGCGIGYDGTDLRSLGEMIKQLDNRAHGILPVAKRCESALQYADQDGKRKGSGAFYVDCFHDDVFLMLDAKKENTDERVRLTDLSIGIILRDKFMELAGRGEGFYTFAPHSVFKATGIKLSDIDMSEWYDKLVADPKVKKTARTTEEMRELLANVAAESGYPYVIFRETMNETHAFKNAKVYSSNLCTEIFQRMCQKYGVQCTLASINLGEALVDDMPFGDIVENVVHHLNGVVDRVDLSVVEQIDNALQDFRGIGVGIANFNGALVRFGIAYESETALDFVRAIFSTVRYHVLKASCDAVADYGKFKEFEDTTYADGTYFNQYENESFLPTTDKVKQICADHNIYVPTQEDWAKLSEHIQNEGLANAYQQAIAPTGGIGYQLEGTASIGAITQRVEKRATGNGTAFYPMPYLVPSTYMLYKDAYIVDDFKYLDLVSAMQVHIDQGISTTLYVTGDYTTGDWWARIEYAWRLGLKSIYYTRPKITVKQDTPTGTDGEEVQNFEECESCA